MANDPTKLEWLKCQRSFPYFVDTYIHIYDATSGSWVPFKLWNVQFGVAQELQDYRLVIILKARQLGMTWLVLAYALWLMLFHPSKTALLFSRRDDEAVYLLERLTGMYKRLPMWCKARRVVTDNDHIWELSNGSIAYGFPTTAGDSYTASIAIVDEADLVPDLDKLMNAVKPTIDGGGSMILLSRSNKEVPMSSFKRMFRAAHKGESPWHAIFLPWDSRPERDAIWYETQRQDIMSRRHSLDDLYQQYPASTEEALQAPTLSKRIPLEWLDARFKPMIPLEVTLGIPMMRIYAESDWRRKYVIGVDPAEGNPTSDASALHVLDAETCEEVATVADQIQPVSFAELIAQISTYYNNAPVLVERNNHGHAVIGHLIENTGVDVLNGWDGSPGWHTTSRGKSLKWTTVVDALRDGQTIIHSESTYSELNSIDGSTMRAPEGLHDDEAVSFSLAIIAALGDGNQTVVYDYTKKPKTHERERNR